MSLLVKYVDASNAVSYATLRAKGVPEMVKAIYGGRAAVLDSLVNRKLQELRDGGWIKMSHGVYTILHQNWQ